MSTYCSLCPPDSKLIGKTRSDGLDDLTLKEVRQAFAAAQTEPLFGDDGHEHDVKLNKSAAADEETKSTNTGTANHLSHLQVMRQDAPAAAPRPRTTNKSHRTRAP